MAEMVELLQRDVARDAERTQVVCARWSLFHARVPPRLQGIPVRFQRI